MHGTCGAIKAGEKARWQQPHPLCVRALSLAFSLSVCLSVSFSLALSLSLSLLLAPVGMVRLLVLMLMCNMLVIDDTGYAVFVAMDFLRREKGSTPKLGIVPIAVSFGYVKYAHRPAHLPERCARRRLV